MTTDLITDGHGSNGIKRHSRNQVTTGEHITQRQLSCFAETSCSQHLTSWWGIVMWPASHLNNAWRHRNFIMLSPYAQTEAFVLPCLLRSCMRFSVCGPKHLRGFCWRSEQSDWTTSRHGAFPLGFAP